MFNITGILKVKQAEQQISDKFKKREFVITENSSQYPQFLSFQLTQDRCGLIENYNVGDEIKVFFNLRGREWQSPQGDIRYFNSLEAWKVEGISANNNSMPHSHTLAPSVTESFVKSEVEDDLPF